MPRSKPFILPVLTMPILLALLVSACAQPSTSSTPVAPSAMTPVGATLPAAPTAATNETPTPTPTDTATTLPDGAQAWEAAPVMIEMARFCPGENSPYDYLPYLVLYGDGTLVKRACEDEACTLVTTQLDTAALCRLTNAVTLTGFLQTDPLAFDVPGGTGCQVRLSVRLDQTHTVEINDLNLWVESPNWLSEMMNCTTCTTPPVIDPAFEDLYRLLSTYADQPMVPFEADRLAVWLTKAVILGTAPDWDPNLPSLADLAQQAACPEDATRQQAVILEGGQARAISEFINQQEGAAPVFREGEATWLVQTRWLLPYELPQACDQEAGLYPQEDGLDLTWACQPEMGAIPTPTPTITPTPTVTATPLR